MSFREKINNFQDELRIMYEDPLGRFYYDDIVEIIQKLSDLTHKMGLS